MRDDRQLAEMGVAVHGILTGFHALGVLYNARRKNWPDVAIHTIGMLYSLNSIGKHVDDCRRMRDVCDVNIIGK